MKLKYKQKTMFGDYCRSLDIYVNGDIIILNLQ